MKWFFEAILFVLFFLLTVLVVTIISHEVYRIRAIEERIQVLDTKLKTTPTLESKLCE